MTPELAVAGYVDSAHRMYGALLCGVLGLCIGAEAMEAMLPGYIIVDMNVTNGIKSGMVISASVAGLALGGILNGYYCDRSGRRPTIIATMGVAFLAGIASALAVSIYDFALYRFICGLGIGGSGPSLWAIGAETFRTQDRGMYLSIMSCIYSVFVALLALLSWILLGDSLRGNRITPWASWRHVALFCTIPSGLGGILCFYFLPESPRLLLQQGNIKQAALWLSRISAEKDANVIELSIQANSESSSDGLLNRSPPRLTFRTLFDSNQAPIQLVILMCVIWYCFSYATFGIIVWIPSLFHNISSANPYLASVWVTICMLPGNLASLLLINRVWRRSLLRYSLLATSFSGVFITIAFSENIFARNDIVIIIPAGIFMALGVLTGNTMNTVSPEYLPTIVRGSGVALFLTAGRIGNISAQLVNSRLAAGHATLLCGLATFTLALGSFLTCGISVEPKGEILEDARFTSKCKNSEE